ncbi:MAG: FAD-binding oxidoreductase [Chloroflexia bacterium]|nr:FAD-binding oxidoreductase [Chloroflexia bacterium]
MSTATTIAPTLDATAIAEFAGTMRGAVIQPDDPPYDEARSVRNGLIDRHPALIANCTGVADVVAAVNFAREHDLLLSVRGGGHNVSGAATNDDGLVIDLSAMRGVRIDPAARTVRVQGGATWGDVDRETQLFGLATPGGVVSTTGVGGLTLHGGWGWLRRAYGYCVDNLVSVDVVTADGQVRTASETENQDLFWAIRGAGSNFGVVTSFEFRLHPVGPLVALAAPFYALEDAERVLPAWRDFMSTAPDEVSSNALFWSIPAAEGFPAELHGRAVLILATVYAGNAAEGERVVQPIREMAAPLLDLSGTMPYATLQGAFDPFFPKGWLYYWKSLYLDRLDDKAMNAIIGYAADRPSPDALMGLWHLGGGAAGRVAAEATAFGSREAPYLLSFDTTWTNPTDTERNIAWTRAAWTDMRRFGSGGLYLNFAGFGEEKEHLVRAGYGANYDRLVELKTRYDPGNLFRMNQNIRPRA